MIDDNRMQEIRKELAFGLALSPNEGTGVTVKVLALQALLDELDAAKSELERMKAALREVHEKLDLAESHFPNAPYAIFSALLEMHGLGKDTQQ